MGGLWMPPRSQPRWLIQVWLDHSEGLANPQDATGEQAQAAGRFVTGFMRRKSLLLMSFARLLSDAKSPLVAECNISVAAPLNSGRLGSVVYRSARSAMSPC